MKQAYAGHDEMLNRENYENDEYEEMMMVDMKKMIKWKKIIMKIEKKPQMLISDKHTENDENSENEESYEIEDNDDNDDTSQHDGNDENEEKHEI